MFIFLVFEIITMLVFKSYQLFMKCTWVALRSPMKCEESPMGIQ